MGDAAKSPYELASEAAARLGIALAASELATLASDHDMGDAEVGALAVTFDYLAEKRRQASIETLLRLSPGPSTNSTSRGYRAATRRRWRGFPRSPTSTRTATSRS